MDQTQTFIFNVACYSSLYTKFQPNISRIDIANREISDDIDINDIDTISGWINQKSIKNDNKTFKNSMK